MSQQQAVLTDQIMALKGICPRNVSIDEDGERLDDIIRDCELAKQITTEGHSAIQPKSAMLQQRESLRSRSRSPIGYYMRPTAIRWMKPNLQPLRKIIRLRCENCKLLFNKSCDTVAAAKFCSIDCSTSHRFRPTERPQQSVRNQPELEQTEGYSIPIL
eukprot:CAMPEP_0194743242 /NCGR_PEP_ID=MMETSP0296-20130528/100202_1 /TAXON_ID=39354 /ORGANISM="Heterosigma akashiwo, Strain CCMP2393" /LENGTH=158 /DNA_ID=CAMNT_0039655247 /DNA_START=67 /DNA_END=543 /DNA_ORIENTATION=-